MYANLKPRMKMIDGKEYELPPGISWEPTERRFRIQIWNPTRQTADKVSFYVGKYGGVDNAFDAAKKRAEQERQAGLNKPPYKVLDVKEYGEPERLGEGIKLYERLIWSTQLNRKRIYQYFMVSFGSNSNGDFKRKTVPIGYAGYFMEKRFNAQLVKAQAIRQRWIEEALPEDPTKFLTQIWSPTQGANSGYSRATA